MKSKIRRFLPLAIVFLAFSTAVPAAQAPNISWATDQGELPLEQLRGKVVYLDFWASWCTPCRQSFPWMNALQARYAEQGLVVVGVNLDKDRALVERFLAKYPAQFTVAYDPSGDSAASFAVKGMPSSYVIDRDGEIRVSHVGFREKDRDLLEARIREVLGR